MSFASTVRYFMGRLRTGFGHPPRRLVMCAILLLVAGRLLPVYWLDSLPGRPGDALLLLAILLLASFAFLPLPGRTRTATAQPAPARGRGTVDAILDQHFLLDEKIDRQLTVVASDTEEASLAIMQEVRNLYDTASKLVSYLDNSPVGEGDNMGTEIQNNLTELTKVGAFIEHLPVKMARDLKNMQAVVKEIKQLRGMLDEVQAIGMQSHILAINTAIEASRAGESGASFRVISQEMRALAANSSTVASSIHQGLSRTSLVVEDGIASSISASSAEMDAAVHASSSIQTMINNFEDRIQYYKSRLAVAMQHNTVLAEEISAVMGHSQYQDVARQSLERVRVAMGQRNAFFHHAVDVMQQDSSAAADLPDMLAQILLDYDTEEHKHGHSERLTGESGSEPKIELF
ncbi:methyl-accepting chemotaxis protein [Acerihabitans sp. TG2]|uniref:methyl-accepting chemotaxis protein n=1 Tax=Acerihabitans sp. TG2 TaxID=3096008 RepID=UPI002B22ACA2|nr:methyl-accepting chemotaxis protein [Acerihabitans sp. TG2]MEA9393217.1 methyl-accepting chemotaxis protein [Acerihabitans sp. TG2]